MDPFAAVSAPFASLKGMLLKSCPDTSCPFWRVFPRPVKSCPFKAALGRVFPQPVKSCPFKAALGRVFPQPVKSCPFKASSMCKTSSMCSDLSGDKGSKLAPLCGIASWQVSGCSIQGTRFGAKRPTLKRSRRGESGYHEGVWRVQGSESCTHHYPTQKWGLGHGAKEAGSEF